MSGHDLPSSPESQPETPKGPGPGGFWENARQRGPKVWRTMRWFLVRGAVLLGSFLLFAVLLVFGAAAYTSRSDFCKSCHIMQPYYDSWAASPHRDVSCIECHFEPGFGGKIRGKMLGLVQLAKYVTGSAGTRPAAEVSDASCLRSGCHETRLLSGRVEFKGMHFDHTPHLGQMRREKQLRCTSCHSQIVQGEHMAVTTSTCFLCHFKDEPFNQGLAACTRCHQIPEKEYDLGGGAKFTHELAYKKGVDCINCHQDVIRGTGEVPVERCIVCHNRPGDLEMRKDPVFMHDKHVTEHKIDCLDCHLRIEHSLDTERLAHAASDCAGCHPNQHQEQVAMFQGHGPRLIPGEAGSMMITRISCRSCHRSKETSSTGTVTWKGSAEVCAMCHEPAEVEKLRAYHKELRGSIPEIQAGLQRAREALPAAKLPEDRLAAAKKRVDEFQADLDFLRLGNDIHNIHYAAGLNRALVDRVAELDRELGVAPPKVSLPPPPKDWK